MRKEHPRVCGENYFSDYRGHTQLGTSPRMRGKPEHQQMCWDIHRNIPAYAGKTVLYVELFQKCLEHPRVCGENNFIRRNEIPQTGTSPRMRGKRKAYNCWSVYMGNIPAYAGKTRCRWYDAKRSGEHPRVCGENELFSSLFPINLGTSPRMRGKRVLDSDPGTGYGNIPAYAGKTCCMCT